MTKQELKDLMNRHYPEHPEYENTLLIRVKFFQTVLTCIATIYQTFTHEPTNGSC